MTFLQNNTMRPKVTIAVAVFNVGIYIEQCARSLFEQTLDDLEIIFVNDASTDDSVAIIEQTLQEYPNRKEQVKILHHDENKGIAFTRKELFDAAQGEYFIYVDSDDWVELQYAEELYNNAKQNDADIVICNYFNEVRKGPEVFNMAPNGEGPMGINLRNDTLNRLTRPCLWCRLIRRNLLIEHDIMWPAGNMAEDVVIASQASYYANKLTHVNEPLYHYRYNLDSTSRNKSEENVVRIFNEFLVNHKTLVDFMKREGIEEEYETGIFINKVAIRNLFLCIVGKPKYWWKFLTTFPEVTWAFLVGNKYHKPSWRERVWIIAIILGLYPKYGRKLFKHCRPRVGWRP